MYPWLRFQDLDQSRERLAQSYQRLKKLVAAPAYRYAQKFCRLITDEYELGDFTSRARVDLQNRKLVAPEGALFSSFIGSAV